MTKPRAGSTAKTVKKATTINKKCTGGNAPFTPSKKTKLAPGAGRTVHTPQAPYVGVYPQCALKDQPEWDGIHRRLIMLLPQQNRFKVGKNPGFTVDPVPPMPSIKLMEAAEYTKFKVGTAAGQSVYIQINQDPDASKTHELISADGVTMSVENVLFYHNWDNKKIRNDKAKQMLECYTLKADAAKALFKRKMQLWEAEQKAWELALVFWVWDEKLGEFPPYVSRDMLRDKIIDISKQYDLRPAWHHLNYCAGCLKALPPYCATCEKSRKKEAKRVKITVQNKMRNEAAKIVAGKLDEFRAKVGEEGTTHTAEQRNFRDKIKDEAEDQIYGEDFKFYEKVDSDTDDYDDTEDKDDDMAKLPRPAEDPTAEVSDDTASEPTDDGNGGDDGEEGEGEADE
ncbi:MAG: hypothetical protein M1812_008104 [Candelaria pacifica]|nr:MAG: hypothetical protein M1812_008104 [Candelaria pacifica]